VPFKSPIRFLRRWPSRRHVRVPFSPVRVLLIQTARQQQSFLLPRFIRSRPVDGSLHYHFLCVSLSLSLSLCQSIYLRMSGAAVACVYSQCMYSWSRTVRRSAEEKRQNEQTEKRKKKEKIVRSATRRFVATVFRAEEMAFDTKFNRSTKFRGGGGLTSSSVEVGNDD